MNICAGEGGWDAHNIAEQTMKVFEISLNRIAKARKARGDSGARSAADIASEGGAAAVSDDDDADGDADGVDAAPVTRSKANGGTANGNGNHGNGTGKKKKTKKKKKSQFLDVHYRPLCDDPLSEVERIYSHFDMELSAEARKNMVDWIANVRRTHTTQHTQSR